MSLTPEAGISEKNFSESKESLISFCRPVPVFVRDAGGPGLRAVQRRSISSTRSRLQHGKRACRHLRPIGLPANCETNHYGHTEREEPPPATDWCPCPLSSRGPCGPQGCRPASRSLVAWLVAHAFDGDGPNSPSRARVQTSTASGPEPRARQGACTPPPSPLRSHARTRGTAECRDAPVSFRERPSARARRLQED